MYLFPAIDLYEGKAVRLYNGDYSQMTVYCDYPIQTGMDFRMFGADHIHIVDLEGAKTGTTPNFYTVLSIKDHSALFCEIGGGIRDMSTVSKYLDAGIDRVILGTAAVTCPGFVEDAVQRYGEKIAVGIDIKDGFVAIKGWTETTGLDAFSFCRKMQDAGVSTVICTDISKDGALSGTNRQLYKELVSEFSLNISASGGISSMDDILALKEIGLYGAVIGKAYYTGQISLAKALRAVR